MWRQLSGVRRCPRLLHTLGLPSSCTNPCVTRCPFIIYLTISRNPFTTSPFSLDGGKPSKVQQSKPPIVIYQWPTMKHFRFISRIKIYQVATMLATLPPLVFWYCSGSISLYSLGCGFIATLGTAGSLAILSYYFTRVIGEMKYDPINKVLYISTLTFWGGRKETEIPLDKIVPFMESQPRMGGAVQRFEVEGGREVLLWSMQFGRVKNLELLCVALKITNLDTSHF